MPRVTAPVEMTVAVIVHHCFGGYELQLLLLIAISVICFFYFLDQEMSF
jgi:hypothetical protein